MHFSTSTEWFGMNNSKTFTVSLQVTVPHFIASKKWEKNIYKKWLGKEKIIDN